MGYTKDLWTRPDKGPDGKTTRVRNALGQRQALARLLD
jgi:hypothetical protein